MSISKCMAMVVVLVFSVPLHAQDALVTGLSMAESASAFESLRASHIRLAGDDELPALVAHASDQIAVLAAWEAVERCARGEVTVNANQGSSCRNVDWFLGFLEGRLRVPLPDPWRAHLSQSYRQGGSLFFVEPPVQAVDVVRAEHVLISRGYELSRMSDSEVCISKDGSHLVDVQLRTSESQFLVIHVAEMDDSLYILCRSSIVAGYERFDKYVRSSEGEFELSWQSVLWTKHALVFSQSLPGRQLDVIRAHGDHVVIYSARSDYAAVHIFDGATGMAELRFTTSMFR